MKDIPLIKLENILTFPNIQLVDTRSPDFFEIGFIKGSLNLNLNLLEENDLHSILNQQKATIIVCKEGTEKESIQHLQQFGVKGIKGILVFNNEMKNTSFFDMMISISSEELVLDSHHNQKAIIIDVRKKEVVTSGIIHNAINIPINELAIESEKLLKNQETIIYSSSGKSSMLACSYLKANGFNNVKNVWGGFEQIKKEPKATIVKA